MRQPSSRSTLFPYTTLFRSGRRGWDGLDGGGRSRPGGDQAVEHPTLQDRDVEARDPVLAAAPIGHLEPDRKSTRLNSSHLVISYAVFCLKKKIKEITNKYTT